MFCPKCGSPNEDTSNFCAKCSNPLNQAAAVTQQNQPPQQYTPPAAPIPPAPKKKHTLRNVVIVFAVLTIAFFMWAAFSPDEAPKETTGGPDETAGESTTPDETTTPALTVIDTAEQALAYIQQLSGESGFEITREEGFIPNDDGTLSVDINSPDLATATCFIISRTGTEMDNYQNSFMVLKGTNQVFYSDILNSGFLLPLTDVAQFALVDNSSAVCDSAEQAVTLIQRFTVDTSWELLYEENFIDNGNGTLAIEINNPDNATVPCFVIQPVGGSDAGGYSGYYIVRKGTNEIYQHQDMNSSDLVKVSG